MAKRVETEEPTVTEAAVEKIEGFAEDLSHLLSQARDKAHNWISQRQAIVDHLTELRDTASKLLTDLGHQATEQVAKVTGKRRGRLPMQKKAAPTPEETRKRVMSPEARQRISDAQKARWAAARAKTRK
jgi:ElaB/YqjD/DUF883 family membrane-anchored ribosome-binding protein